MTLQMALCVRVREVSVQLHALKRDCKGCMAAQVHSTGINEGASTNAILQVLHWLNRSGPSVRLKLQHADL